MDTGNPELLPGTLDLLILSTLLSGPAHGYAISQSIRHLSGEAFAVEQGSLYPALYRIQKKGWIKAKWTLSDTNRRVKTYRLTPAGRRRATAERAGWEAFATAMARVLKGA